MRRQIKMDECARKCLTVLGELLRESVSIKKTRAEKKKGTLKMDSEIMLKKTRAEKKKRTLKMSSDEIMRPFDDLNLLVDFLTSDKQISRTKANSLLGDKTRRSKILPPWFLENYEKLRRQEKLHITHVRKCMDKIVPGESPNQHDYSKDELYIFITICAFNVKDELCRVPKKTLDKIISEHHRSERHHPEFEKLNNQPLVDKDILEMAVDRLSRNLQFNQGRYNEEQLIKFEPKFESNHENNITLYKAYISSLKSPVEETWREVKRMTHPTSK